MILIYLNCTISNLYNITNLYRRKISTFFLSNDEILVKKTPTSWHEKRVWRQWTLILIFFVGVHMGLDPLPLSTCVHLSPTPSVWTSQMDGPLGNISLISVVLVVICTAGTRFKRWRFSERKTGSSNSQGFPTTSGNQSTRGKGNPTGQLHMHHASIHSLNQPVVIRLDD